MARSTRLQHAQQVQLLAAAAAAPVAAAPRPLVRAAAARPSRAASYEIGVAVDTRNGLNGEITDKSPK